MRCKKRRWKDEYKKIKVKETQRLKGTTEVYVKNKLKTARNSLFNSLRDVSETEREVKRNVTIRFDILNNKRFRRGSYHKVQETIPHKKYVTVKYLKQKSNIRVKLKKEIIIKFPRTSFFKNDLLSTIA